MKKKTKIELTVGYAILALIAVTIALSCNRVNHLYEAKMADTACYGCNAETYEIGAHERWNVGDSVIVDETNFVDMDDVSGRIYVITKDNGTVPVQ